MPSAFFETTKVAWEKVVVTDGAVPAQEFTAAARAIIAIFDQMTGMGIVKGDMEGNIAQLEKNLAAAGSAQSVQALVEAELASGTSASKLAAKASTSCCAALWLTRALYFILKLLERLIEDPARSLSDSVSQGYEATLKQHHNFVVRGTFSAALYAAPKRAPFMLKLGDDDASVCASIAQLLPVFKAVLKANEDFLMAKGVETKPMAK